MFSGTTFKTELRILLFVIVRNTTESVCVVSCFFFLFLYHFGVRNEILHFCHGSINYSIISYRTCV